MGLMRYSRCATSVGEIDRARHCSQQQQRAMYGDIANKLILDAKRSSNLSELPLYQQDLVRDIVQEIGDLNRDIEFLQEQLVTEEGQTEEQQRINNCHVFVTHLSMRRNKRCLLAYQRLRAEKIDEFCWLNVDPLTLQSSQNQYNRGASRALSSGSTTNLIMENLSHAEQEYYRQYQGLILDFKSSFGDIDLSGDLQPPTDIFIDVRVLKDGGEVQTEYGVFNLIKDSQFFVRKSDVERLIQQGYLEEI